MAIKKQIDAGHRASGAAKDRYAASRPYDDNKRDAVKNGAISYQEFTPFSTSQLNKVLNPTKIVIGEKLVDSFITKTIKALYKSIDKDKSYARYTYRDGVRITHPLNIDFIKTLPPEKVELLTGDKDYFKLNKVIDENLQLNMLWNAFLANTYNEVIFDFISDDRLKQYCTEEFVLKCKQTEIEEREKYKFGDDRAIFVISKEIEKIYLEYLGNGLLSKINKAINISDVINSLKPDNLKSSAPRKLEFLKMVGACFSHIAPFESFAYTFRTLAGPDIVLKAIKNAKLTEDELWKKNYEIKYFVSQNYKETPFCVVYMGYILAKCSTQEEAEVRAKEIYETKDKTQSNIIIERERIELPETKDSFPGLNTFNACLLNNLKWFESGVSVKAQEQHDFLQLMTQASDDYCKILNLNHKEMYPKVNDSLKLDFINVNFLLEQVDEFSTKQQQLIDLVQSESNSEKIYAILSGYLSEEQTVKKGEIINSSDFNKRVYSILFDYLADKGGAAISHGARGKKGSIAYFQPDIDMISTNRDGVKIADGSLCHEVSHRLDYFVTKQIVMNLTKGLEQNQYDEEEKKKVIEKIKYLTGRAITGLSQKIIDDNPCVKQAHKCLEEAKFKQVDGQRTKTDFFSNNIEADKGRNKSYFSTDVELWARLMESYVYYKGKEVGVKNPFLVNIRERGSVYLTREEFDKIEPELDNFMHEYKSFLSIGDYVPNQKHQKLEQIIDWENIGKQIALSENVVQIENTKEIKIDNVVIFDDNLEQTELF